MAGIEIKKIWSPIVIKRIREHPIRYARKGKSLFFKMLTYLVLLELSFIFVLPILYILSTSSKSIEDYLDSTIVWIPTAIHYFNFEQAFKGMYYMESLTNSLTVTLLACIGQVLSCAITGYGFGRYKFPGSGFLFSLVLLTLLVPPQTIIISLYSLFKELGWINTFYPFIIPSFFAHGLRGALFILIFRQFFRSLPTEIEEAARIDGAGAIRIFTTIMVPLAKPAIIIVGLFSLVWHWNDYYEPILYLNREEFYTLPIRLESLGRNINDIFGSNTDAGLNEPVIMAACFLIVAPLFILYILGQSFIKEGIERTGFGGE